MPGRVDNLLSSFFVKRAFGGHTTHDTASAHGHVRFFMGKQNSRADGLITAAGRIGAVDSGDDRYAHLFQFRVTEKACSLTAAVGVNLFLFGQFYAGAVYQ